MWPASMLANRRTLCETGRERNDRISIATIIGRITIGMPFGTNRLKKCKPLRTKP